MLGDNDLKRILSRIDGKGYKAYKDIQGAYDFGSYQLFIDHVQGDPFAPPSRVRVFVPQRLAGFLKELYGNKSRQVALEDYLTRIFARAIKAVVKGNRGLGSSGLVSIDTPGQEVLERSSMFVSKKGVEVRFVVGLPARGRTVMGFQAQAIFFEEIPQIVRRALLYKSQNVDLLEEHIAVVEDQDFLRGSLKEHKLVAFLGDGAVLPRRSGVDDRPLPQGAVVFRSPPEMRVELKTPNTGKIGGMGIPEGITLIVGGGFHGKSTLLNALERGVYNHIPGDGRENVVARSDAVKIRAEDGRYVEKVDISPFINNLPLGRDTVRFATENASGSTSQSANIMEALEAGSRLFLIDEDTSATNFMIRDERMQRLVAKEKEPITPFVDQVESLYRELGVSTVLVMGGSGDYFDFAHRVVMMDEYVPLEVTAGVKKILDEYPTVRLKEGEGGFERVTPRRPVASSFDPSRGKREVKIDAKGLQSILFGRTSIDLGAVEQIVNRGQTRAIGELIHLYADKYLHHHPDLRSGLEALFQDLDEKGMDLLSPFKRGDLAMPRLYEVAAAINRMRSLKVR